MKVGLYFAAFGIILAVIASCGSSMNDAETMPAPAAVDTGGTVLVELFTSEGCSSCPPADGLLTSIAASDKRAITLEFHVDYWNSPSWNDPFSSAVYSQRQEFYSSRFGLDATYTPQMVVDGKSQFVGSDRSALMKAISEASGRRKVDIQVQKNGGRLKISISGITPSESATIYIAVAEDDLASRVSGGENSGANLRHNSVVRTLNAVGSIEKGQPSAGIEADLPTDPAWKTDNLHYVVFVQENGSRAVIAVASIAP